jgi:hypothetical protein
MAIPHEIRSQSSRIRSFPRTALLLGLVRISEIDGQNHEPLWWISWRVIRHV